MSQDRLKVRGTPRLRSFGHHFLDGAEIPFGLGAVCTPALKESLCTRRQFACCVAHLSYPR